MRFIIENPNNEVMHATLNLFKNVFGAYRVGNTTINHIDFSMDTQEISFYTILPNEHEKKLALDIIDANQLSQVLAFIGLGMEFDEIKELLENQNAI